jgi:hypothetical protein
MGVRGDGDHPPGAAALLQALQEQVGQEVWGEVVDGEGALQPVDGDAPGGPVAADVVDQHVHPRESLQCVGGQLPDLALGGEVRDEDVDSPATGGLDLSGRVVGPAVVPAGDRDISPQPG